MAQVQLPREVLKWLQTLDLTFSVKDARRDFSNGFLVAEVFSRFFPAFEMHSFENASSLTAKRNNWAQILRLLAKLGVDLGITRIQIEEVVHSVPETTLALVVRVYELLTGRCTEQSGADATAWPGAPTTTALTATAGTRRRLPAASLPPFARPTASFVAYATARQPAIEAISDDRLRSAAVGAALAEYEHALIADRLNHPERYAVAATGMRGYGAYARRAAVTLAARQLAQLRHPPQPPLSATWSQGVQPSSSVQLPPHTSPGPQYSPGPGASPQPPVSPERGGPRHRGRHVVRGGAQVQVQVDVPHSRGRGPAAAEAFECPGSHGAGKSPGPVGRDRPRSASCIM